MNGVCEHCTSRFSWDCDDGLAYPKHGCDSFKLDWNTLSKIQQKAIIRHLDIDEEERWYYE